MILKISTSYTLISCREIYDFPNAKLLLNTLALPVAFIGKLGADLKKNLRNSKYTRSYEKEEFFLCTYNPNQDRTEEGQP